MISLRQALMGGAATCAVVIAATPAFAEVQSFDIPAQPARTAIQEFGRQSGLQILASQADVGDQRVDALKGEYEPREALRRLLIATNLRVASDDGRTVTLAPQSGSAAGDGADQGTVQALVVTAQKREENIQDVPIAMSAFTQEDLTRSQVAGGPDLITQVPNMTFTKTNFSSYSIQLRGIGTQAISATTDPAVAVAFNNTPFTRNRFFEQEFYDLQRVEVLRGPQGTLYGRNATAGVVNIISQKPKFTAESKLSADLSNFSSSRLEGMVNIPLVDDVVAVRLAGAWTKRDGYSTNELNGNSIDGRNLWSTRLSLRVSPNDRIDANLIWEHFQEDDDRLRSGKQLCKKDIVTEVAGFTQTFGIPLYENPVVQNLGQAGGQEGILPFAGAQAVFSQGCTRNSLYAKDSFQRPQGQMLPYYLPLRAINLPAALTDPYVSVTNSKDPAVIGMLNDQPADLRVIQSTIDPNYRAKSDIGELQVSFDLTDELTLSSETAYGNDFVYSLQDFNRFNTAPGAWRQPIPSTRPGLLTEGPNGGIFCDPQLGCSDRLVAVDISTAKARQFSQEFRLASSYQGPFNFSLGANFLRADSEDKYYVFFNSTTLIAADSLYGNYATPYQAGVTDNLECLLDGYDRGDPLNAYSVTSCTYIDPNPIGSVNDEGHNYFLSKNPYKLISYAIFGEAYYQVTDALKITAGLRWTVDKKDAPRVPTWILISNSYGYPVAQLVKQEWREPTGRLAIDWKPDLSFTDETLLYASYAHGYKAGGANPPGFVRAYYADRVTAVNNAAESETRPKTFDPEFVNAYELGAKNTLADGRVTLNLAAFFYDYTGYQVSEIVDRSAFNRNFDATVWGVELEADWRPLDNLRLGLKGGYEDTRIKDGEHAIDLMDRTAGDPRWVLMRPFPTYASSCIVPAWLLVGNAGGSNPGLTNLGSLAGGGATGCEYAYQMGIDPPASGHTGVINYTQWSTDPNDYPGIATPWAGGVVSDRSYPGWDPSTAPNNGEGIAKPLGGNELPNAPNWTWTITGDYSIPLPNEWLATLHTDLHWQGESWWRVFNDNEYDKLHPYFTMNLAAIFTNEERGWNIMAYVKNVTDETAITGAFLNSDDTGLTTNVFLTEPRLYGLRVTKNWSGAPALGSFGQRRNGPFPLTVEIGGQIQRLGAQNEVMQPSFGDAFAAPLDLFDDVQRDHPDWGDERELKLTWRSNGPFFLSAGARFGKTNLQSKRYAEEQVGGDCIYNEPLAYRCALAVAMNPVKYGPMAYPTADNQVHASAFSSEDHAIVDFTVGRDTGFGGLARSSVSAGLRFARFKAKSNDELKGVPDWFLPPGIYYPGYTVTHTVYRAQLAAEREFEGAGPVLSWDAALPLLSSDRAGSVDLEWSVSGGALFGHRDADISIHEEERDYITPVLVLAGISSLTPTPISTTITDTTLPSRSSDATVPVAGASLGLSYSVGAFTTRVGYRWERYFDAIDGGFTKEKNYDRTIDGPYFKIAVGFGG